MMIVAVVVRTSGRRRTATSMALFGAHSAPFLHIRLFRPRVAAFFVFQRGFWPGRVLA
jgi:hypothetical protein